MELINWTKFAMVNGIIRSPLSAISGHSKRSAFDPRPSWKRLRHRDRNRLSRRSRRGDPRLTFYHHASLQAAAFG